MICEKVSLKSKSELIHFLRKNEEYSLFLLSNLETYGLELSDGLYSGNYKILKEKDKISTAFCLTKKGNLLVQSKVLNENIYDAIVQACLEELIPISGVLGEWSFASSLWNFLKGKKLILKETLVEKEVLYCFNITKIDCTQEPDVRLLKPSDFDSWVKLRIAYAEEMSLPANSAKELEQEFLENSTQQIIWGLFFEGKLVAIADLNARFDDLGQLGGVYTIPNLRKRGFSTRLVRHIIHDAKIFHHIKKLIIFTGENNLAARRVYESFGILPYGNYALLFGEPTSA